MHFVPHHRIAPFAVEGGRACACVSIRKNSNRKNNPQPPQAGTAR